MRRMRGVVVAGAMVGAILLGEPSAGWSEEAKPELATSGGIREALSKLGPGRSVEILLTNGKSYSGKISSVGHESVLLTQIGGKEFYDVLIDLDEVAAVELRVRGN